MSVFPAIGDDLMRCVDLYNQAQSKWFEEMVTTSLVIKFIHLNNLLWTVDYTICLELQQSFSETSYLIFTVTEETVDSSNHLNSL